MMSTSTFLEGLISVEAVLKGNNRHIEVIYLRQGKWDARRQRLVKQAKRAHIEVKQVTGPFIDELAQGKTHGGVLAQVGPRRFIEIGDLVAEKERPFIVMLDGVEDPFNFGQAIRALYAAGADGLVVRPRNWLTAAGTVARASAGVSELMPMAVAETAIAAASFLREHGLTIACTAQKAAVSLYQSNLRQPLFLLIGGEKRGITRSFLKGADLRLQIPYQQPAFRHSLGVAASAAVIGFEVMRQRMAA